MRVGVSSDSVLWIDNDSKLDFQYYTLYLYIDPVIYYRKTYILMKFMVEQSQTLKCNIIET